MDFKNLNYPVIYKITNLINGKIYIGKSINFYNRYKYYKYNYKSKKMYIYRAMVKYGFENFKFEIIQTCDVEDLIKFECYWINKFNSLDNNIGYNVRTDSKENSGFKHSEETKRKISEKCKGRKPWHNGKKGLPCYCSKETLKKFSESMTGKNNPNSKKVYQYDKNLNLIAEYESVSTAAKILNISFKGISKCATKSRKFYKSFIWSYCPL